jgi:opacity protein-like surface antigen
MIKKLLTLSIATLISTNLYAEAGTSYAQLGYERISIEVPNKFKADDHGFIGLTLGHNITDNIAIEIAGMIPMSADSQGETTDYYRTYTNPEGNSPDPSQYSDIQNTVYSNDFESKGFAAVNFKLTLPIHERFSTFVNVGYAYGSYEQTGYGFIDNSPAVDLNNAIESGNSLCEITGVQSNACGNPINDSKNTISGSSAGFTYGGGFSLHLADHSSFVFEYNQYLDTDEINASAISASYQWRF